MGTEMLAADKAPKTHKRWSPLDYAKFSMSSFLFLFDASVVVPLSFQPYPLLRKLEFEVIFLADEEI